MLQKLYKLINMISQIFILSARGDILINRDLRGDLVKDTPEIFFRNVKLAKEDHPPIFNIDGINYIFLHRYSIYIVATSRFNVSPSLVLEYLNQVTKVIKDFCGMLSEEAIRKNFVLIYEVLDEMMDFGYPQLTSTDQVKDYIVSPPEVCNNVSLPRRNLFNPNTIKVTATMNPITNAKERNEIFVDVVEKINVLFNSSNIIINSSIDGSIRMKSFLTGSPVLKVTLNSDSYFDDYNFDEHVDDTDFNFNRKLTITPPAGEFVVMNYRMSRDFTLPFKVFPFLNQESPYKIELLIKVKCELPKDNSAKLVTLRFTVPDTVSSVYPELEVGSKGQKVSYEENEKTVVWKIESFKGETEHNLVTKISMGKEISMYQIRKEIGPIKMGFEINQMNSSPLKIKSLIIEGTEKENPNKWVRYITTSNSYVTRI